MTTKNARVYRADAAHPDARVYQDGMEVFDVVAVCPAEGWAEVIACKDGRDYHQKVDPNEWFLKVRDVDGGWNLTHARIYGAFRLIDDDGNEYE